MPGILEACLTAMALAASAGAVADPGALEDPPSALRVAALRPAHLPGDLVQQALPPAPHLVVRQTGYYGTVTIDHRAHLARRVTCKACHGPGPVTKIEFTPRLAHDRCVGCHRLAQRAPTECKGCHVMPPADAQSVVAAAPTGPATAGVAGVAVASAPVAGQPLAAVAPAQGTGVTAEMDDVRSGSFRRAVGIGACAAGSGFGPAFHLSSRHGGTVLEHSADRLSGRDDVRTNVLVGGGIARALRRDLDLVAVGLGGIDVAERPAVTAMPALGGRVGVEWAPPPSWLVHSVRLSVTGLVDVANRRSLGRDVGGAHLYATLATGFRLGAR